MTTINSRYARNLLVDIYKMYKLIYWFYIHPIQKNKTKFFDLLILFCHLKKKFKN